MSKFESPIHSPSRFLIQKSPHQHSISIKVLFSFLYFFFLCSRNTSSKAFNLPKNFIATPKGNPMVLADIQPADITIAHRTLRYIQDGYNARTKLKSQTSQTRLKNEEQLDRPLMNSSPDRSHESQCTTVIIKEFTKYCPPFTVLPDFWKHWALKLRAEPGRGSRSLG